MSYSNFHRLFNNHTGVPAKSNKRKRSRSCRIEELESREMLSVTPFSVHDTDQVRRDDLELTTYFTPDYNRIEVTQVSVAGLQSAINEAAQTVEDDLIVVKVDSFEAGIAALRADMADNGKLKINIDSWKFGGVSIVAMDSTGSTVAISDLLVRAEFAVSGGTFFNNNQYYSLPDYQKDSQNGSVSPTMQESKPLIGMDDYLNDSRFSNLTGTGYTTVIIDTGIYAAHSDFADKLVYFYDFYRGSDTPIDTWGHGTHVASIAAGWEHGIAQGADIVALNIFPDDEGVSDDEIAVALQWVVDNAAAYNIVNVNMSLGGGNYQSRGDYSGPVDPLLHTLADMGIIVSIATGNSYDMYSFFGYPPGIGSPATNASAVSVSATYDQSGRDTGYGSTSIVDTIVVWAQRAPGLVDILAPGSWITAAGTSGVNATVEMSGTSMAAPMIAGTSVLAQQLANTFLGRSLTVNEFKTLIQQTGVVIVDDVDYAFEPTYATYYRIDVYAMADAIYNMGGGGETLMSLYPVDKTTVSITVAWNPVPGAAGYELRYSVAGAANWTTVTIDNDGEVYTHTITGLLPGTAYDFQIRVSDVDNTDTPWSMILRETTLHAAPTGFRATSNTPYSVTLEWTPLLGVTGYEIQYKESNSSTWRTWGIPLAATTSTTTIAGLTASTGYEFQIRTVVGTYRSDWNGSVSESTTPTSLTDFRSTGQAAYSITLTWTPQPGLEGYILEYKASTALTWTEWGTLGTNASTVTVTGLDAATTYDFRLTPVNAVGQNTSLTSARTTAVVFPDPVKTAKAKTDKKATSFTSVTLTWVADERNTEYAIICTTPGVTFDVEYIRTNGIISGAVITGLKASTSYKFSVVAKNAAGKEAAAVNVSAKTKTYAAVKGVKAAMGLNTAVLTWKASTAPETTGYRVYVYDAKGKNLVPQADVVVDSANLTARITNLADTTKYTFFVHAQAGSYEVQSLAVKRAGTTAKYTAVAKLKVTERTDSGVTLTWTKSKFDETTGYEIVGMVNGMEVSITSTIYPTSETTMSAIIRGLDASTKYTFFVRAVVESGNTLVKGSLNAKVSATTLNMVQIY